MDEKMDETPAENILPDLPRLTQREIEVLAIASEGHRSKEIAAILHISKRTVDFHLQNIYNKWKVDNRIQALRYALKLGLIEPYNGW